MSHSLARLFLKLLNRPDVADCHVQRLADLLQLPVEEVLPIPTNRRLCYRHFTIGKRHGGRRQIAAPSAPLKALQRKLLRGYLAQQHVHAAAMAFCRHTSPMRHAQYHLGQAIVVTVDLADFFPATTTSRVRRWFAEQGWKGDALDVLVRLCTYRGGLPQGAPTSPALSNLVNFQLDAELSELAVEVGARYSRYADDLAFSWSGDLELKAFCRQVEEKLRRYGYHVQPKKSWRWQRAADRPEITGLVLDGPKLRLPARILRRIRQLRSHWLWRTAEEQKQLEGYRGVLEQAKRSSWAAQFFQSVWTTGAPIERKPRPKRKKRVRRSRGQAV